MSAVPNKSGFPEYIERFNSHQRWQHIVLFVSMILLIITGFAIKWADMGWAQAIFSFFGGFENTFNTHLVNGVIMCLAAVYHIVWMIVVFIVDKPSWSMIPNMQDAKNVYLHALYLLRIRKEPPLFDRYTYLEKFEYLAGGYGVILMGITGYFLWFPDVAATIMPRWVIHLLRIAHSNEAIVASMAVFLGHFFWVHFHPDVVPSSAVWYNGKQSRHHNKEEHILEYERLSKEFGVSPDEPLEHHASGLSNNKLYIAFLFIVYAVVCAWLYAILIPIFMA